MWPANLVSQQSADSLLLVKLEAQWNDAHIRGDADALDRLWADDLVVIVPGMAPMGKGAVLAFARSGRMRFDRYVTSQLGIHLHGDAAVVTGRMHRTRTLGDQVATDDWNFMKVYGRRDGAWRVIAFTASPPSG